VIRFSVVEGCEKTLHPGKEETWDETKRSLMNKSEL
jgi:hypothetical protein